MERQVKLIIHGHFYQPPREDPWTNEIDDQTSVTPYKNWNYRIADECYRPNAFSRVLTPEGKIERIINNYRYLSFNFGPTLLSWLEKKEPEIYEQIIQADKLSVREHGGHGNAIAQVYNHVIMPLQTFEDKKTQIVWGLRDFERRFGRASEGIWLSETAVDYKTVDLLIEYGIRYIILSPLQASSYRGPDEEEEIEANEGNINTSRAYKIIRSHGEIGVFYYNKEISTAVSFEHLLRNSYDFADRIINNPAIQSEDDVLIIATDGEIYGHHEPFGDMCLSSIIKRFNLEKQQIKFMNFGEYLDACPPKYETTLWLGDDGKGSSWSCVHGVGRWHRDCGCQAGGDPVWNQRWRSPLRSSFDAVKEKIDRIYLDELKGIISDPWALRNAYIDFILDDYPEDSLGFLDQFLLREIGVDERKMILRLLEAQKYALLMYTSCAWFFSELSGIETEQTIRYAYKAITLLNDKEKRCKKLFENKIKEAKSNIPAFGDGRWILNNHIYPKVQDIYHIANNFIVLLRTPGTINEESFFLFIGFSYKDFSISKIEGKDNLYEGAIFITDKKNHFEEFLYFILDEKKCCQYKLYLTTHTNSEHLKKEVVSGTLKLNNKVQVLTENDLLTEVKHFIVRFNISDHINTVSCTNYNLIDEVKKILAGYREINLELPDDIGLFIKNVTSIYIYKVAQFLTDFPTDEVYTELLDVFKQLNFFNLKPEISYLQNRFSRILYTGLSENNDMFSSVYSQAVKLIEFCNKIHISFERSRLENKIYNILKTNIPGLIRELDSSTTDEVKVKLMLQLRRIILLADIFNISTEEEKKKFFSVFESIDIDSNW